VSGQRQVAKGASMKESLSTNNSPSRFVRRAETNDIELLYSVCRQSYIESFADHWQEGGLAWYLDKVYGMDVLARDLTNPDINYYFSYCDGQAVGFMKIRINSPLTKLKSREIEIEKLYFLAKYQRQGLGKLMIERAMGLAKELDAGSIWLAVIDTNSSAIRFYERNGFKFFDKSRLEIPYFKDELRGMWRMVLETPENIVEGSSA
jgi:ribosomal protein S18 acetylase RimI-like enzyme